MTSKLQYALVMFIILVMASTVFPANVAKQVDFLAAGLEASGVACSGCKVYTYEARTTTAKTTYTDREKTTPAANPVVLNSEGRYTLFADGVYKFVIKSATDVTLITMDGISYGGEGLTTSKLSSYGSLSEAIADIGSTKTVLIIDTTDTLNENVTVPSNVTLMAMYRDAITLNTKTLTINGDIWGGAFEWIIGTGTVAGSPNVQFYDPTWTASTVTDSTTPSYKAMVGSGVTLSSATLTGATITGSVLNTTSAVSNKIVFSNTVSFSKGADIASAATLQLGADGNYFDVTGTTDISNISGRSVGTVIKLHFDGALTIINSTNLEVIGVANITTAAGDEAEFVEYDTAKWRMTSFSTGNFGSLARVKILSIGDWDMDATASRTVAHGLTANNIRTVTGVIRNDAKDEFFTVAQSWDSTDPTITNSVFFSYDVSSMPTKSYDATNIYMTAGNYFNSANFDDVGGAQETRGWITVIYVP